MIKICSESLNVPLRIIYEQSLKESRFPEIWKEANVVLVHKKEDKNLLKNYFPINLLPIFSKIFERVIYNSLFNHFQSTKLFTSSQSRFLTGDSCIAQLLSIIYEIEAAFDNNPTVDVRGVFLTSEMPLIKSGIVVFYSSYKLMGLKVNYLPYLKIVFIIVSKD